MTRPWERQPWFEYYKLAVLEMDPATLPERIHTAKAAIKARIAELGDIRDRETSALQNALNVLRLLEEHKM